MEQSSQNTAEHWQRTWDTYDKNDPRAIITGEGERRGKEGRTRGRNCSGAGLKTSRHLRKPAHSGTGDKGGWDRRQRGLRERSHRSTERDPHGWSVPRPCTPQPEHVSPVQTEAPEWSRGLEGQTRDGNCCWP